MAIDLDSSLTDLGFDEHREFLRTIARPSIEIRAVTARVPRAFSKLNGPPDLPADFEWPRHKLGSYRFIGQFNLAGL